MQWPAHRPDRHQLPVGRLVSFPVVTLLAVVMLACAACAPIFPATHAAPGQDHPVIRMPDTQLTPTVPPLTYTVGAWPSNSAPTTGSNVTIFISFRNAGRPVSGAAATAVVRYPNRTARFGPVATASNGYASLSVPAGGVYVGPDHGPASALVSVYVTYLGKTYSTEISFAPLA